ncbi:GIY-YIG nuclease family protein [Sulfurimonas sp.]|uniref:GIY-YIG nuclease family protein n=1 Tax=Sulfurimonas sp. TaxID=2022749 RepID=UPI0035636D96
MNRGGVYQIVNTENGKRYVGSAKCFRTRWRVHKQHLRNGVHHSKHLQRSWDTYKKSAFAFEIIMVCAPVDLLFYEQRAIDVFDSFKAGYNCAPTAGSQLGFRHSEKSRRQMGDKRRGAKQSPEQCAAQSKAQRSRTDVKTYEFRGKRQTMLQWAEELGWQKDVLARRVKELGLERAFTAPHRLKDKNYRTSVQYAGKEWLVTDLAAEHGVSYTRLQRRIRLGWPVEEALKLPKRASYDNRRSKTSARKKAARKYSYAGLTMSITEWAKHLGISRDTLAYRIGWMKWDIGRALSTPAENRGRHA